MSTMTDKRSFQESRDTIVHHGKRILQIGGEIYFNNIQQVTRSHDLSMNYSNYRATCRNEATTHIHSHTNVHVHFAPQATNPLCYFHVSIDTCAQNI